MHHQLVASTGCHRHYSQERWFHPYNSDPNNVQRGCVSGLATRPVRAEIVDQAERRA